MIIRVTLCWICITMTSACASNAQSTKNIEPLREAVEALRKAMVDPKEEALDALVAPELSYGHSSGRVEGKTSFITSLINGDSDFITLTFSDITIELVDNVAIVRHKLAADTNDAGKGKSSINLGVMLVWKKTKGKWKLIGRQSFKL